MKSEKRISLLLLVGCNNSGSNLTPGATDNHTGDSTTTAVTYQSDSAPCNVYVNTFNASDQGDGSEARPFGNLAAALGVVAPGGTIIIGPGVYHTNLVLTRSVVLRGSGSETRLLPENGELPGITIKRATRVSISDLTISGFHVGIMASEVGDLTIAHCNLTDKREAGIRFVKVRDAQIAATTISGTRPYDHEPFQSAIALIDSSDVHLTDNVLTHNQGRGMFLSNASRVTLDHNTITDTALSDAVVADTNPDDSSTVALPSLPYGLSGIGLYVEFSREVTISSNQSPAARASACCSAAPASRWNEIASATRNSPTTIASGRAMRWWSPRWPRIKPAHPLRWSGSPPAAPPSSCSGRWPTRCIRPTGRPFPFTTITPPPGMGSASWEAAPGRGAGYCSGAGSPSDRH